MIKLRLSSMRTDKGDREINILPGELLETAIKRIFEGTEIKEEISEVFQVAVNGHIIGADLWTFTSLKETDTVLVALKLKGDNGQLGQLFILAAILFVAPYAVEFLGAAGGYVGLVNMGVAVIAGYMANQLFPPPVVGGIDEGTKHSESQMYSISSQANAVRKFGTVPKVYGRHKMFPVVAANPYVELEPDPNTGELAMYLYAIYDFGMGPVVLEDLKIGNTLIERFSGTSNFVDLSYNLVDPNKPLVSEGIWDDVTQREFTIYKGDISSDAANVTLDGNENEGDPSSEYQVVRSAATNGDLLSQEVTINFTNPQGVFSQNSNGDIGTRSINLTIEFARVGTDIWFNYNDLTKVQSFRQVGNDNVYNDLLCTLWPANADPNITTIWAPTKTDINPWIFFYGSAETHTVQSYFYRGLPTGSTSIILDSSATTIIVGDYLKQGGKRFAQVSSIISYSGNFKTYNFVSPTIMPITIYIYERSTESSIQGTVVTDVIRPLFELTNIYKEVVALGKLRISGNTNDVKYSAVKFTPIIPSEYMIRVTRTGTTSDYTYQTSDSLILTNINTRMNSDPINTTKRHTFMEIRIRATGQLNGTIQNLSAICTSVLDVWNGTSWVKAITQNPAWVYADLITGEVSKRPLEKSRLDITSLVEWAEYCAAIPDGGVHTYTEVRFGCNFILDYDTTLQEVLNQVTSAAQASVNIIDGKYGVLLDVMKTTPVQIFTPRNSTGFSSSRVYTEKPHALKVTFVDPGSQWQPSEFVVYDNGYTVANATEFQDIVSFACVNVEQAFRFGRYFLAQNRLRQETISIKTDFEHLICTRGDFVQVAQDTMRAGGTPARCLTSDTLTGTITIDEALETDPLLDYGFVFRGPDGISEGLVDSFIDSTTIVLLGSPIPAAGDMVIIGEYGSVVFDCLVKSITPESDLSATLLLIEKADGVYDFETVADLPEYIPNLSRTVNANFSPPPEVDGLQILANTYNILTAGYEYYIDLDWGIPSGVAVEQYEVYVDFGKGLNLWDHTRESSYRYIPVESSLDKLHTFKILAVSASGKKLNLGEVGYVSATPASKITPPSDVNLFFSDITNEVLQLTWVKIPDLDCAEYIIRYNPDTSGNWETSTLISKASGNANTVAVQARTGIYSIKAFDFNGNESVIPVYIITTIPQLSGLNVIDTKTDFPTLAGGLDRVNTTATAGSIQLNMTTTATDGSEVYYSEGYYYMNAILDLQDIYTVRLQSQIIAEGFNSMDLMSNWLTLSELEAMANSRSADWDVELQYRSTETFNSISDWDFLSNIAVISEGAAVNWTAWRKFLISDATGRIFQFRIKLISNKANVTPRVIAATVRADMPDRLESINNLTIPIEGYVVDYDSVFGGSFIGPGASPNVQITIENAEAGDYPSFSSKTLTGFEVVILNNLNNPVDRDIDVSIKGYGKKSSAVI